MQSTNVKSFISDLSAGIIEEKLGVILSKVALATALHGEANKKGKVAVEFTFQRFGEGEQVMIAAKLSCSAPTKRGKSTEEDTTDTPMFVGKGGVLSVSAPKEDNNGQFQLIPGTEQKKNQ